MKTRSLIAMLALICAAATPLRAAELIGADFFGTLYDMTETGVTTNPRSTGINTLSGIAFGPNGKLYGHDAATDFLWEIDAFTGASSAVGFIGLDVTEGDLAFDPISGILYGVQTFGEDKLFTLDTNTGVGTVVGTVIADGDISAMAFDASGNLFTLDTRNDVIYRVDPTDASILETLPIGANNLGGAAGMVFDPDSGLLYVADGGPNGTNQFYVYVDGAQTLFPLGALSTPEGLSGLTYVPEPASLALLLFGGAAVLRRRRGACYTPATR